MSNDQTPLPAGIELRRWIRKRLRLNAPPARVFCVWADPEELARYGSRLELEGGPFPLDQPGAIEAWAEAIEGWSEALAMLRAHLDFSVDLRPLKYGEAAQLGDATR